MHGYLACYLIAIAIGKNMARIQGFIQKQADLLVTQKSRALVYALVFALFPYTAWLAVIVIALITLRKGCLEGAVLLLPTMLVHLGVSLVFAATMVPIVNTLTLFLPCYFAACALRVTTSWQAACAVLFLQISLVVLCVQWMIPDFVMTQFVYLKTILEQTQSEGALSGLMHDNPALSDDMLAGYAFGIQMLSVVFSALSGLMFARSIQSRLYHPDGFRQEVLSFRAKKIMVILLVVLFFSALQKNMVAMMMLPSLVMYFLLSGLSLSANIFYKKNSRVILVLLLAPLMLLPFVMVPLYGVLGLVDSLFNLRVSTFKFRRRG